jgi:hypothetical protein
MTQNRLYDEISAKLPPTLKTGFYDGSAASPPDVSLYDASPAKSRR